MTFKELDDSEKELIRLLHANTNVSWDYRMKTLSERFSVTERTVRRWISQLGYSNTEAQHEEVSEQLEKAKTREHSDKKYYLITWAQNNTPVHKEMLRNMEAYAEYLDAEILVVAGRYRNPVSLKSSKKLSAKEEEKVDIKWLGGTDKYLTANRHSIHKYLNILADVKVQPTAENPITGFEGFSGLESTVIGHPKQHLKSLPILDGYPHKVLMSTGAITKPNYTDTKAGKKGEFHHVYGFLVVEIRDEEVFHIRNVNVSDSGEFNDLFFRVYKQIVSRNETCEGFILGDLHHGEHSEDIIDETDKLFSRLRPRNLVLHDVFDAHSISHHHEKDPFTKYSKNQNGRDLLDDEIRSMVYYLGRWSNIDKVHIVRANHDEHVERYLRERDWKKDIQNSVAYMKLATAILEGRAPKGIIPYKINEIYPEYNCLSVDDSLIIEGIECGMHGDKGANGSRGSVQQFKRLNVKTVTGHTHTPEISGGSYSAGTSTHLRLDYNKGLSSWMNAHVKIDNLGKRQMILFADGYFTTLY